MNPSPDPNPRVLFVEDDAAIMSVMVRYLSASGYEVERADTIDGALRSFTESPPDIIVTDIFLAGGGGDGFALIERVRAQDPDLPIIAISGGRAGFDVLAQAAKLGADATIEKPFSAAYLVDTIDRCLEGRVSGA
jgi:two-component system C4-dicarboxylate transport response regulator DctD